VARRRPPTPRNACLARPRNVRLSRPRNVRLARRCRGKAVKFERFVSVRDPNRTAGTTAAALPDIRHIEVNKSPTNYFRNNFITVSIRFQKSAIGGCES
jgi:hypothetical protein